MQVGTHSWERLFCCEHQARHPASLVDHALGFLSAVVMGSIMCNSGKGVCTRVVNLGESEIDAVALVQGGHGNQLSAPPTQHGGMVVSTFQEGVRGWLGHMKEISLEYNFEDLAQATNGFSDDCRLGAGAAGAVYQGTLRGGTQAAIKVLVDQGGLEGFEDEVRVLSRFRHPNLVTLFGWGARGNKKFLLYELLPGGDVEHKLAKCRRGQPEFSWSERLKTASDSACGLSHMVNNQPVAFHRDIKPANILLDSDGTAKMADFGLAGVVHGTGRSAHLYVKRISGTPGYACPAYMSSGLVCEQTEVYSFGIVLLEFLLCKQPCLCGPQGDLIYPLLKQVQPSLPGAHERILAHLDVQASWPRGIVDEFADLALSCVDLALERRPPFAIIVRTLRRLAQGQLSGAAASEGSLRRTGPADAPDPARSKASDRRPCRATSEHGVRCKC